MEIESNLRVTFSRRKTRLFKKSNELTTLCGAEMMFIIFSPRRKETQQLMEAHKISNISELNARVLEVHELLEVEKRRGKSIVQALQAGKEHRWWERSIEEMTCEQLKHLKGSLENVKTLVAQNMFSNPIELVWH
ncbi:agamous-like MADS-box protein AGL62 [Impatiens glandulifera]|uniref:agamous-like MADS-box protein AGL62 n=1 Tax=Impatiens glandulifera TaxID=253017 RepID=UPI001FB131F9|nr:agamous-like MADS-box protein AGL62 [Impatiens glandulifera]